MTLIGAPTSYVGFDQGSQLVNDIRRYPRVALIFDEIEKAHPLVAQVLMGILDRGECIDPRGIRGDFRHAYIFFTSNVLPEPASNVSAVATAGIALTPVSGSAGNVTATGRTAGVAIVHVGGTDNAPTVFASPRPADMAGASAGAVAAGAIGPVMIAGNSVGGTVPVPGQGSTTAQPLTMSSVWNPVRAPTMS